MGPIQPRPWHAMEHGAASLDLEGLGVMLMPHGGRRVINVRRESFEI